MNYSFAIKHSLTLLLSLALTMPLHSINTLKKDESTNSTQKALAIPFVVNSKTNPLPSAQPISPIPACNCFHIEYSTTPTSACGTSDGSITISNVTGGSGGPYFIQIFQNGICIDCTFNPVTAPITINNLSSGLAVIDLADANFPNCEQFIPFFVDSQNNNLTVTFSTSLCSSFEKCCSQNQNGQVIITNVTGGTPPYFIGIDNAPLVEELLSGVLYQGLAAGTHYIHAIDSAGCATTIETTIPLCPLVEKSKKSKSHCKPAALQPSAIDKN